MLLELFPFVILNNAMAFAYAYFFSDFLRFNMSLLLLTLTMRGVSNKHCSLSLFSLVKRCPLGCPNQLVFSLYYVYL